MRPAAKGRREPFRAPAGGPGRYFSVRYGPVRQIEQAKSTALSQLGAIGSSTVPTIWALCGASCAQRPKAAANRFAPRRRCPARFTRDQHREAEQSKLRAVS